MTTPTLKDWIRFHGTFEPDPNKKVVDVGFQIEAKDAVSSTDGVDRKPIYFTDIQFQAGNQLTGWTPEPREMLKRLKWTNDENQTIPTVNAWTTVEDPNPTNSPKPRKYENVEKRIFNIVGRGHRTIVIPNYYPEDWSVSVLPTGIDLILKPKEAFDAVRISTSAGVLLPEEKQFYKLEKGIFQEIKSKYEEVTSAGYDTTTNAAKERKALEISNWENIIKPLLDNHPIHYRYTREFWVDGSTAESEIKIHATTRAATVNGNDLKIVGENGMNINGTKMPIDRKKFLLAPKGTATIRIEFYKQVEREIVTYDNDKKVKKKFKYLKDVGIGYHGTASFYQWTYGRSRV